MDRWAGKVAVVTGGSSGIGAAIVVALAKSGMKVVAVARRLEKIQQLIHKVGKLEKGSIHSYVLDLNNIELIPEMFKEVRRTHGGVDVMVNCAGISTSLHYLMDMPTENIKQITTINLMAYIINAREAIRDMKDRNSPGHIFNINSVLGHRLILNDSINYNLYPASKFAITAVCDTTRYELALKGTNIRMTSISPGTVNTEIFKAGHYDDVVANLSKLQTLEPDEVAQSLVYALSLPQRILISELTIMNTLDLV